MKRRYYEGTCAECGTPITEGEEKYRFLTLGVVVCADCVNNSRIVGVYDDGLVHAMTRRNDDDEY